MECDREYQGPSTRCAVLGNRYQRTMRRPENRVGTY